MADTRLWHATDIDTVEAMWRAGATDVEIGAAVHRSLKGVRHLRGRFGWLMTREEQTERARARAEAGDVDLRLSPVYAPRIRPAPADLSAVYQGRRYDDDDMRFPPAPMFAPARPPTHVPTISVLGVFA